MRRRAWGRGLAASVWALVRRPVWGLLGAWFFLILAPTSSILPSADLAFEHRMYLPLAAVVAVAVIVAYEAIRWCCARLPLGPNARRWALAAPALAVTAALCLATHLRNRVYSSEYSAWSDVVAKASHNARAHNSLGAAMGERGDLEPSLVECRKALEIAPQYAAAHYNLGKSLAQLGRNDQAVFHFQRTLEIIADRDTPESPLAHSNLAYVLYGLGKIDEAVAHYRKALEIDPETPAASYNLANALSRQGKFDEAIAMYDQALQINPQYAAAHTNLANTLYRQGKLDRAAAHYTKALTLNPRQMEAHCSLAAILIEQGRLEEAVSHCRQAIDIDPNSAEAFYNLSRALWLQAKRVDAVACWRQATRLQPKRVSWLRQFAWALATCPDRAARNGDEALKVTHRAIELSGESPELLDVLAAAQAENGRFAEAVATAQKALRLASDRGNGSLAKALRARLRLYQADSAFRDPGPSRDAATPEAK